VYVDMVPLLPYRMQREDLNGGNLLPLPNSSALAHLCVVAMNEAVVAVVVVQWMWQVWVSFDHGYWRCWGWLSEERAGA
jgi:hypothetical protein